jgi:hypothetical protein
VAFGNLPGTSKPQIKNPLLFQPFFLPTVMKTLQLLSVRTVLLATAASLGFATASQAQFTETGQPVNIKQVEDMVYVVQVSNPSQQKCTMQLLRSKDGAVLYKSSSFQPTFGQKLNVRNLTDGQYTLVVQTPGGTRRFGLDLGTSVQRTAMLGMVTVARN